MIDCQHEDCEKESVGAVVWDTDSDRTARNYCQYHIRKSQQEYPELIADVNL